MKVFFLIFFITHSLKAGVYEFPLIFPGAREEGVCAASAMKGDCFSIYFNPASISFMKRGSALFSHTFWYEGIHYDAIGVAFPRKDVVLGLNMLLLYTKFERFDIRGNPQGDFWSYDLGLSCTFAKKMDKISAGFNAKFYHSHLMEGYTGSAFALDFGVLTKIREDLLFGASLQNIGTKMKYLKTSQSMPLSARVGLCAKLKREISLFSEVLWMKNRKFSPSIGLEAKITKNFLVRAGVGKRLCFGATFRKKGYRIDYVSILKRRLGICHKFVFGVLI